MLKTRRFTPHSLQTFVYVLSVLLGFQIGGEMSGGPLSILENLDQMQHDLATSV